MKTSLFDEKIQLANAIANKQEKIKQIETEIAGLKAKEQVIDGKLHMELRDNNLTRFSYNDYEFTLATSLVTAILDSKRKDAIKYDKKFDIGLFKMTLNGMRLKAWVKELLDQRLEIPSFVSYQDYKRVQMRPIKDGN